MDAIGNDVADPDVTELAYDKTPLRPLLSLAPVVEGSRRGAAGRDAARRW